MSRKNPKIMLVNPPMNIVKPDYPLPCPMIRSSNVNIINPGLLIIASYLHRHDIELKIVDLSGFRSFEEMDADLENELHDFQPDIVGISSSSAFDYLESLHAARKVKELDRSLPVIMGGQQAGPLGEIVFQDSEDIDIVATSEGEWVTLEICRRYAENRSFTGIPGTIVKTGEGEIYRSGEDAPKLPLDEIGTVHFPLYPNFRKFPPYIEQSRGCAGMCAFCLNRQMKNTNARVKSKKKLEEELEGLIRSFGPVRALYLLDANFGSSLEDTLDFAGLMKSFPIHWSTEFRVDTPWEEFLEPCSEAGLMFCDIGLESSIPSVLKRIRKTPDPEYYRNRFKALVKKASGMPYLKLTVHLMSYIGMGSRELMEDFEFIREYASEFNAVSYASVLVPEASDLMRQMKLFSERYGSSLVMTDYARKTHLYPVNVSSEVSYEESIGWCNIIEKYCNRHVTGGTGKTGGGVRTKAEACRSECSRE